MREFKVNEQEYFTIGETGQGYFFEAFHNGQKTSRLFLKTHELIPALEFMRTGRPTGLKRRRRIVITPHKGYYKSFGSPHAADDYITIQEEESYLKEYPLEDHLTKYKSAAWKDALVKAINSLS